jgi:ubiquinone/menaquinone biosynthesis C-methylase UbiE
MEIEFTGERVVPDMAITYGVIEHLHRYAVAREFCGGRTVLDIASGEGYGTSLLAAVAAFVYGIDISSDVVRHARAKYGAPNLSFLVGEVIAIPIDDRSVDVITCFETIEHLEKHEEMLAEFCRVLKPSGLLILSTPESSIYHRRDPGNKFHRKEIGQAELQNLVSSYFRHASYYNQMLVVGSLISPITNDCSKMQYYSGSFSEIRKELTEHGLFNQPFFNLVICSNDDKTLNGASAKTSLFCGYQVYANELAELRNELDEVRNEHLPRAIDELRNRMLSSPSYRLGNLLLAPFRTIKSGLRCARAMLSRSN